MALDPETREVVIDKHGDVECAVARAYHNDRKGHGLYIQRLWGDTESMKAEVDVEPPQAILDAVAEELVREDHDGVPDDPDRISVTYIDINAERDSTVTISISPQPAV